MRTKEEILKIANPLKVNIWSHKRRLLDDLVTNTDECEYCGKKLGKNPLYVHVTIEGICVPNGITEKELELIGLLSQGCFPIGNCCAKKLFGAEIGNYTFRYNDNPPNKN